MIKKQTIEYKIVSIIGLAGEIQTFGEVLKWLKRRPC